MKFFVKAETKLGECLEEMGWITWHKSPRGTRLFVFFPLWARLEGDMDFLTGRWIQNIWALPYIQISKEEANEVRIRCGLEMIGRVDVAKREYDPNRDVELIL